MIFSTIVFLIYYWRVQFQLEKLDFQRSSREFLQQAISRLQQQIDFFGRPFRIYAFLLVLGVNGTASEIWQESSPGEIIGFHAAATAILLLVIIAGIKFRQWRFRKEIDPLVEEMQALIKAQDE